MRCPKCGELMLDIGFFHSNYICMEGCDDLTEKMPVVKF